MSQKKIKKLRAKEKVDVIKKPTNNIEIGALNFMEIIRQNFLFLVIVSVGILALYANSLNGNFVSDDYAMILNNPQIKDFNFAFKGFNSTNIINYMLAVVFGVKPIVFHLFSVILFTIVCWLAFLTGYLLFGKTIAVISTVVFAVHPIHVEAVSWVSGKPYLLIAFYVLIMFLLAVKYLETGKYKYLVGSGGVFLMAFLTDNPRPFSIFLIMGLYILFSRKSEHWNNTKKIIPWMIGALALALVVAWPNIMTRLSAVNSGYNQTESIFYNPFFQYPVGISKYLQLLLVPVDLTLYHTVYAFPVWLNWLIMMSLVSVVIYSYSKDRRIFFALTFIIAAILPSMAPVKVSWLVAERYMFLGSLGFCWFLAIIFDELRKRKELVGYVVLSIVVLIYSVRLVRRNVDWQTNHNLWVNTCYVSPNSHNAWNNIGDDYDKLADYENAIKGFTQSTIVKPNYADAYHNRANILYKIGRFDLARESYQIALHYSPTLYQTYMSLTQIDLNEGKIDSAVENAKKLVELQPNISQTNYVLGVVMAQAGDMEAAKNLFQRALQIDGNFGPAKEALLRIQQ